MKFYNYYNMNNKENEEYKKKRNERRLILLIGFIVIGGVVLFNLDAFMWAFGIEKKTSIVFDEDESTDVLSDETAMDSSIIVLDTIGPNDRKDITKKSSQSNRYNSSSSYSYDDDDELNDDPEYREGGKYDPAKYHTDYSDDQEERRRRFIDNDGFDDDDGYDEYRGYEHEYERSAQWDD